MLLFLLLFYFDRLEYFCESKLLQTKNGKRRFVVPYLDAIIERSSLTLRGLTSNGKNEPFAVCPWLFEQ